MDQCSFALYRVRRKKQSSGAFVIDSSGNRVWTCPPKPIMPNKSTSTVLINETLVKRYTTLSRISAGKKVLINVDVPPPTALTNQLI